MTDYEKGMINMLDLENVKEMLQSEYNNREQAKADMDEHINDTYMVVVYEKIYIKYRSRFNAMCDLLFEMGYLVFIDDDNIIRVEKRRGDNKPTYVPF